MLSARLAPFIANETAAVVAAGESTPSGEDSGVSVAVDTKGSGKGLGTFCICGLVEPSCAVAVGETAVGVGMGVSRPPEIQTSNLLDLVNTAAAANI